VAGWVLKRVKFIFKGFQVGAKVIKPNAKLDAVSGHKLSSGSSAISGRGSGPGCLQRLIKVLGRECYSAGVDVGGRFWGGSGSVTFRGWI
jgi:hypothetical protein